MTQEEFNKHYKEFLMNIGALDMRSIMKLKGVDDKEFDEKIGKAVDKMDIPEKISGSASANSNITQS